MSYTAWSVVTGEQPSAAKWNLLGTNDAFFSTVATLDGWIDPQAAFTYASATTFTTTAGVAAALCIGDRIKLTQTTVKYFVVVSVSGTTVTITGGTDYTLANAAITSPYFSHAASPVGWPGWFAYTTSLTGFSANPTGLFTHFSIYGRMCTVHAHDSGNGTSNTTAKTWTLPIAQASVGASIFGVTTWVLDNNVQIHGVHLTTSGSTTVNVYPGPASGTSWTASGNCRLFTTSPIISYEF